MTIFLEIAKEFLRREINDIREASVAEDGSKKNALLTYFTYGRDLELSAAKRQLLNDLIPLVKGVTDSTDDKATFDQLKALISTCKGEAASKSRDKGYDEGSFGPAMQNTENLLQSIFDKLSELKLLDIPHDKDPFNIFRYFAALYFAQKIADGNHAGVVTHVITHPHVSSSIAVTLRKEKLVIEAIESCAMVLGTIDSKKPNYVQATRESVVTHIRTLQGANLALCDMHAVKFSFFKVADVKMSALQPKVGFLAECMDRAIAAIEGPKAGAALSAELEPAAAGGAGREAAIRPAVGAPERSALASAAEAGVDVAATSGAKTAALMEVPGGGSGAAIEAAAPLVLLPPMTAGGPEPAAMVSLTAALVKPRKGKGSKDAADASGARAGMGPG